MNGPLPVPLSEIKAYCEMFEIQGVSLRGRVLRQIQQLDRVYLNILSKHREEHQKQTQNNEGKQ